MSVDERFALSLKDHEAIYRQIEHATFFNTSPVERPRGIVLGGQPGTGKSTLLERSKEEFEDGNVVVINGDEYRYYHPGVAQIVKEDPMRLAELTDPDVRDWTKRAFDTGIQGRYNLVFEGTMREQTPLAKTLSTMLGAGYEITARVVAAHSGVSMTGIMLRYEEQLAATGIGRWANLAAHDAAYHGMPVTIQSIEQQRLAHHIEVLDRSGHMLYQNHLRDGAWQSTPNVRQVIEAERSRVLSAPEVSNLDAAWSRIFERMHARLAPFEEIRQAYEIGDAISKEIGAQRTSRELRDGIEYRQAAAGTTYQGRIIAADQTKILQVVQEQGRNVVIEHDRRKLTGSDKAMTYGADVQIRYVNQTGIVSNPNARELKTNAKEFGARGIGAG